MRPRHPTRPPRSLMCFVCGELFSRNSLEIHIKNCRMVRRDILKQLPKWSANADVPLLAEIPGPTASAHEFRKYNQEALKVYDLSLRRCKFCNQLYSPFALLHHLTKFGCESRPSNTQPFQDDVLKEFRPKMVYCSFCCREYTARSLPIHERQCCKRREQTFEQLPPHVRDHKTMKVPECSPAKTNDVSFYSKKDYDSYNMKALDKYNSSALRCVFFATSGLSTPSS
eukprot:Rmarinus@m.15344